MTQISELWHRAMVRHLLLYFMLSCCCLYRYAHFSTKLILFCIDCTPNNAENAGIVSYRRPNDLFEFHTINHTSNATADTLQRLYERISSRTNDSTKYCLDFFNIKPIVSFISTFYLKITKKK